MKTKEEAIAPFCHFEQQEQQLKITIFQISEFLTTCQNYQILYWLLLLLKAIKAFRLIGFNWYNKLLFSNNPFDAIIPPFTFSAFDSACSSYITKGELGRIKFAAFSIQSTNQNFMSWKRPMRLINSCCNTSSYWKLQNSWEIHLPLYCNVSAPLLFCWWLTGTNCCQDIPGPLAPPFRMRPSRKMMARSYSLIIWNRLLDVMHMMDSKLCTHQARTVLSL